MNVAIQHDLSLLGLITNASVLVQLVMLLLLVASLASWWFIFLKMFSLSRARKQADAFEQAFWSGSDLNALYQRAQQGHGENGTMERIFQAGFTEFMKLRRQSGNDLGDVMDGTRRAMRAVYQREMDRLESQLPFLATVGSVSPYVGLFGTVWGIMNAFRGLSTVVQATLSQVAPGIAEALIATAMGLFAAIPAVVAYNRYTYRVYRLSTRYDAFMEEFSNILQRQGHA